MFHLYLRINVFSQLIQPDVQLLALVAVPVLIIMGIGTGVAWASGLPSIWIVLGFSLSLFNIILALLLDKAWRDFRHLIVVPLPLPFSLFPFLRNRRSYLERVHGTRTEMEQA